MSHPPRFRRVGIDMAYIDLYLMAHAAIGWRIEGVEKEGGR